jgi:hypothetical protein
MASSGRSVNLVVRVLLAEKIFSIFADGLALQHSALNIHTTSDSGLVAARSQTSYQFSAIAGEISLKPK